MYPVITLGSFKIASYTLLTYISFVAAAAYGYGRLVGTEKIKPPHAILFLVSLYFVQSIGGTVAPFLHRWYLRGEFPGYFFHSHPGRYFYSTLMASALFIVAYSKVAKWSVRRVLDYFGVAACLMSAIGRIGCFLAGCCSGKPTHLPWALKFPPNFIAVHPTQIYHLIFEGFILFPLLLYIERHKKYDGQTFWIYLLAYGAFRALIELIRTNPIAIWGMTNAQAFSVFLAFCSGLVLLFYRIKGEGERG